MEQKTYTIEEVLTLTIRNLNEISVPVGMFDQVGVPIRKSIGNLQACLQVIESQKQQQAQEEEKDERVSDAE